MRRYFIRIYIHHDKDLAIIRRFYKLDLSKAVYCSMRAYLKGELFAINLPEKRNKPLSSKRVYSSQLKLYEGKDDDLIRLLESISSGNRNIFMKNLLRMYLCMPFLEEFFEDKDIADEMISKNVFRKGKRKANAADIKSWNNTKQELDNSTSSDNKKIKRKSETIRKQEENIREEKDEIKKESVENTSVTEVSDEDVPNTEFMSREISDTDEDDLTALFSSLMQ